MKKFLLFLTTSLTVLQIAYAQNVGINSTGATPAASAMLDISSTDKGLLIPRVALTATNTAGPVISPATSLLVYNTATAGTAPNNVIPGYYYWNSTAWVAFTSTAAASTAWTLGGNTGVTAANFVGTGDDRALIFKSNNLSFLEFGRRQTLGLVDGYTEYTDPNEKVTYVRSALQFEAPGASFYKPKMWTDTDGNFRVKGASAGTDYFEFGSTGTANNGGFEFIIGDDGDEPILFKSYHYINGMSEIMRLQSGRMAVGSNAFDATNPEKLLIDAGNTTSYNLMTGKGSIDNYLQINVKNSSGGGSASSDLVASSNNGTESVNYIDMGINSGGYSNTSLPVLGGANTAYLYSTGTDFVIGNATASRPVRFFTGGTANSNERMRIDGSGRVGIANLTPTEALDVTGNFRLSGAFMPNNSAGTLGYVLQSNGVGAAPAWVTPGSLVSGSSWALDGNSVAANRNFGTITNFALPFITNNTQRMLISNTGNVGIGTSTFNGTFPEKFIVDAGNTTSVNAIVGKGSINNYLQLNIQNTSAGTNASSDVVATANNGSETTNYVDMGINSSTNTSGIMGGANDAYLYNLGQDFLIGTGTAAKSLILMTGGTSEATNERMRIDGSGNVGIGFTAPTHKLDVNGAIGTGRPSTTNGSLVFSNSTNANAVTINTGITTTAYSLTLPAAQGAASSVLTNNGSGVLSWSSVGASGGWSTLGNSGTNPSTNFLGTTDNQALVFRTNNSEKVRVSGTGDVGIGTSSFNGTFPEKFLVDAGTTTSVNAIVGKGNINNYLQLNIQNQSGGTNASSDVVATANNGSETTNFVDMGINSGGNTSAVMGGANDAYLYNIGQNLLVGTGTAAKSLVFMTGGTSQITNERMRIDGTGRVGIGTNAPSQILDIIGNFELNGAFMPGGAAGTAGYVLGSSGAGASPTWLNPATVLNTYSWSLGGNSVASNQNLGTTTNFPLPFITNNTEKMRLFPAGGLAIGATALDATNPEELLVNAGTTTSFNLIGAKGSINNYLQLNVQNQNAGAVASSDIVATANNGTELVNFVDLGINSSGYSATGVLGGANNAYLYSTGNDFVIGNTTPSRNLEFFTGGSAVSNERMRIDGNGNVGIGTTTANSTLAVNGSLTMKYRSGTGAYIVLDTDYVVLNTGGAANWTLPVASTCAGRIYRLINQGTGNITLSQNVTTANGATTPILVFGTSGNFEILSDGSVWRKIN